MARIARVVAVLSRSLWMPKAQWRLAETRRTLDALNIEPALRELWHAMGRGLPDRSLLEARLTLEGRLSEEPQTKQMQVRGHAGMLGIEYGDAVSIVLERDACLRETGLPPRATRKIAALKPWQPVQVVLNGYRDTPPVRMYSLQDRHLILCSGDMPEALSPARRVDLQEDLP